MLQGPDQLTACVSPGEAGLGGSVGPQQALPGVVPQLSFVLKPLV